MTGNAPLESSRITPELWYRLGRYRQLDFEHLDVPQSITILPPREYSSIRAPPYYKLDLAGALEMAGNIDEADSYFRAAQAAYPISAEVAWKYGNFLLRQGSLDRSLRADSPRCDGGFATDSPGRFPRLA